MRILYAASILIYLGILHIAAIFNRKARQWVEGRKDWRVSLKGIAEKAGNRPKVWIHCASLGEFEQGRPLIEGIKNYHPEVFVLLTFFSPSGFKIRKNYAFADAVAYLPGDTPRNARDFLDLFDPDLVLFVKYEFWFNILFEIRTRKIPALLVSARFRPEQIFFKSYGDWFLHQLQAFSKIFLQESPPAGLLKDLNVQVQVAGDTRIDRALQISAENHEFQEIKEFCRGFKVLIAGSTWPPDEALIASLVTQPCFKGWKLIIAPHDVRRERIEALESAIPLSSCRHTALQNGSGPIAADMLVIDHIGILSAIYRYGNIAYIGGGFGSGLHNTLEPIAFALPVIFGPKYHKFTEAVQLITSGGAFCVKTPDELEQVFQLLADNEQRARASQAAFQYIQHHAGATAVVLKDIFAYLNMLDSGRDV